MSDHKLQLNVLVACEESQRVCIEFRKLGHRAFSCDVQKCSGGHPEWHIQGDVLPLLNGHCTFETADTHTHTLASSWDLIVSFPPCTHLTVAGATYFEQKRKDGRQEQAIEFFCRFFDADCEHISIENPINIISGDYVLKYFPMLAMQHNLPCSPTQRIQPWMFGHPETKTTCLWLKSLPPLKPTKIIPKPESGWENQQFTNGKYSGFKNYTDDGKICTWNDPETAKIRSRTYPGIAKAMATQWSDYLAQNGA